MFDYSYQYFLSYIISVSTNRCKVACCENVRTGAWWCLFPLPAWPLTAIETSCVKQSLLSLICKVLPFASALKNTPFSTVWNSALSLLPSVFDYSYYRKLLLLARSGIFVCVVRMHACTCVYLSLDLFLGAVCLSPPDCNPAVLGSMFCNLSLTVGVCVHHEFVFFVCQCCVIYRHLTTVGRFGTIQRFHPTLNARPKLCSWAQISCPLPTPAESQQKQSRRNWVTFTAKSLLL